MGYNPDTGLYVIEPRILVNTREFTRTAQDFKKNKGFYTKLHPKWDKREYKEWWTEERRRRRYGYSVGGVKITGNHYNFLNFTQILKGKDDNPEIKSNSKRSKKERDFPDFWDGHYYMSHAQEESDKLGLHFLGGKSRRKGFSYWGASCAANETELNRDMTIILGAYDTKYLTKGDGIMTMARNNLDFYNQHTAFKHGRIANSREVIKLGYKLRGTDVERGLKSTLLCVSLKEPDAIRGKDAFKVYLEELGSFPNLSEVLDVTIPALEEGDLITGHIIGWGTAGNKAANWEEFEKIFYNPRSQGFMAFENVWDDDGGMSDKGCGYFFPYWQNYKPHIDDNGNSIRATAEPAIEERKANKKKFSTAASFSQWCAERANKPSEAFSRSTVNIYSSAALTDWINFVIKNRLYEDCRKGQLIHTKEGYVKFRTNAELERIGLKTYEPIHNVPFKEGDDLEGCVVEYYPPYLDAKGNVPKNLYRIWIDPYGVDKEIKKVTKRDSLGAIYVYERANTFTRTKGDVLVARYVGRPGEMALFNDISIMLAEYYGGHPESVLFESDRGDVRQHYALKKKEHLLAPEPDIVFDKETQYTKKGRKVGLAMGLGKRKGTASLWFRDWIYKVRDINEDGVELLQLYTIKDLGLLREIEKYNPEFNFDRLSCNFVGQYDMREQDEKEYQPMSSDMVVDDLSRIFTRKLF